MSSKSTAFVRTPTGVKIIVPSASVTLTFLDITKLKHFMASGELASTPKLRRNMARNDGALEAMSSAELERELERRGRLEPEDDELDDEL